MFLSLLLWFQTKSSGLFADDFGKKESDYVGISNSLNPMKHPLCFLNVLFNYYENLNGYS